MAEPVLDEEDDPAGIGEQVAQPGRRMRDALAVPARQGRDQPRVFGVQLAQRHKHAGAAGERHRAPDELLERGGGLHEGDLRRDSVAVDVGAPGYVVAHAGLPSLSSAAARATAAAESP